MRILASKLRQIGDGVLWTSALAGLRQSYPEARIELLTPPFGPALYAGAPFADEVHTVGEGRWALGRKIWQLRQKEYDLFLGFHANTSLTRLAYLIRAKEKVLHHHSWHSSPGANTRAVPHAGKLEHVINRDWRLLEALGLPTQIGPTRLYVSNTEKAEALAFAAARGVNTQAPLTVLLPGARVATRRYPEDLWKLFAKQLAGQRPAHSVLIVVDSEQAAAWNLHGFAKENGLNLFSDLSLRKVLALMASCRQAVGNDSGLIHAAAALGLETVSIFGAGCFGDFSPLDARKNRYVRVEVDCRAQGPRDDDAFQYCTLLTCDHHSCMRRIAPATLLSTINEQQSQ